MTAPLVPREESEPEEKSWLEEMRNHYYETGELRPADLHRLLGDPSKVVYMKRSETSNLEDGNNW